MTRVSSNWTLFYRLFLPTFWIVFFGVAVGMLLTMFRLSFPYQVGVVVFYALGILLLYVTLLRLKRVECDASYLYVTNYFKTYRYTFESVAKIHVLDFLLVRIVVLHFREKTSFGRNIYFIRRRDVWNEQVALHPELQQAASK